MTTEMILTILGIVVGSNALFGFIQFLISRRDSKRKKIDAIRTSLVELGDIIAQLQQSVTDIQGHLSLQDEALMSNAQDRIIWLCKQYLNQGRINTDDYVSLKRMADAYRALGGNSLVKDYMDQVDRMRGVGNVTE